MKPMALLIQRILIVLRHVLNISTAPRTTGGSVPLAVGLASVAWVAAVAPATTTRVARMESSSASALNLIILGIRGRFVPDSVL